MKKFLSTLVAVISVLCIFMLSACGDESAETPIDESISTSSQKSKISRGDTSVGSNSANTSLEGSDGGDSDESDVIDASFGASGDDYIVQQIDTSNLSTNAKTVANLINTLGTITAYNFDKKGGTISYAKDAYAKLNASEKAEVKNYESLLGAEKAYNAFVKSVSDQAIIEFKAQIELIKDCEVDATFDQDVEEALAIYDEIGTAYKSNVANEYNILQGAMMQKSINALPSVENLKGTDYKTVKQLTETFSTLSASTYVKYNETKAKLDALNNKLKEVWTEITFIACDTNNDGIISQAELSSPKKNQSTSDKTHTISTTGAGNGQADSPISYSDNLNPTPSSLKLYYRGDITINATCGGTLTMYLCGIEKECAVSLNGTIIESKMTGDETSEIWEIEVPEGGTIGISAPQQAEALKVFAIKFGYPKL